MLSLDELTNGDGTNDGKETSTEEAKEGALEDVSPFAAALDYTPWYDIASRVRHREPEPEAAGDTIGPVDNSNVIAVSLIAVITGTGGAEESDIPMSPLCLSPLMGPLSPGLPPMGPGGGGGFDRAAAVEYTKQWDPAFAACLQSEAVLPLVAPFSRANFVMALGHMKQRVKSGKTSGSMPEHSVLTVCETRQERGALSSIVRRAGIDTVAVDQSELQAAVALQTYDCILMYMESTKKAPGLWGGMSNSLVPSKSSIFGGGSQSGLQKLTGWIKQLQEDLNIKTPIVVLTPDANDVREQLTGVGAASVLVSPCSEQELFQAVTGMSDLGGPKGKSGKSRNKNTVSRSESNSGITSTDGGSKNNKIIPKKRRNSITMNTPDGRVIEVDTGFDMERKRFDVKRRGSWSGGWCTQITTDTYACSATRGATHHVPQDRVCILENFICKGHTFFGVFDGHGPLGHHIATFISMRISDRLLHDSELTCEEDYPEGIQRACVGAFNDMIELHEDAAKESGCTASFGIVTGDYVYVGNVGDSRTCYVRDTGGGGCCGGRGIESRAITQDHTPELESEAERVKKCGALVMQMGPVLRVVHPNSAKEGLRGLAMSRSFGDLWARYIGVVAEPQVYVHKLTSEDRYIMCGSDGVWDMLSVEECGRILPSEKGATSKEKALFTVAVKTVVETASSRWKAEGMEADDISFCVISV